MRTTTRLRRAGIVTGVVYVAALAVIALLPTSIGSGEHSWSIRALNRLHESGMPAWISYALVESAANILLFVPLGGIVVLILGPRAWLWAVLVGVGASVAIEAAQLLFLASRVATVNDVLANSSGAAIGAVVAAVVIVVVRRRHGHGHSDRRRSIR